ncbi:MAG: hypothetical protein V4604_02175 [Bacteroidota bacterium]
MKFVITPEYQDLFDDSPELIEASISKVPLDVIVKICCYVNSQLYLNKSDEQLDLFILNTWLADQTIEARTQILGKYKTYKTKNADYSAVIFSTHHVLGFLHDCIILNNNQNDSTKDDFDPSYQLAALKMYVHGLNKRDANINLEIAESTNFYHRNWPMMIGQDVLNTDANYFNTLIKSMCFFDYFQFELGHDKEVKKFLENTGCENGKNYAFKNLKLLQDVTNLVKPDGTRNFVFTPEEGLIPLYDTMSLNFKEYKSNHSESKNFSGLKEFPLYKINGTNVFSVVDWNFFGNKIYSGLVFDFYNRSGLKNEKKNDFVNHYKPKVAEMIEKHLLAGLLKGVFEKENVVIQFDSRIDNHPDAYIRIGKRIFLIEIKDALFPAGAIESRSYDKIKSAIDEKYNSRNKGTGQIIQQLQHLQLSTFEDKTFEKLKIKRRNLIIYPIIIYTDSHFGLHGIGSYLNHEFSTKVDNELSNTFGRISRLAFINIDFFIQHFSALKNPKNRLDRLMDYYNQRIQKSEKDFLRHKTIEKDFEVHSDFEHICHNQVYERSQSNDYVQEIFESLNLNRGVEP